VSAPAQKKDPVDPVVATLIAAATPEEIAQLEPAEPSEFIAHAAGRG